MEVRSGTLGGANIIFPSSGGTPVGSVTFSRDVENVVVLLTGFDVQFAEGDDRHFKRMRVRVSGALRSDRRTVDVTGAVVLRDKNTSGDTIKATIHYVVIADRRGPVVAPPSIARKGLVTRTKAKRGKKASA
jgi:hypothetical protein